jgi:hypothetical protein
MKLSHWFFFILISIFFFQCAETKTDSQKEESQTPSTQSKVANLNTFLNEKMEIIQGKWKVVANPKETFLVENQNYTIFNAEEVSFQGSLEIYENCPEFCSLGSDVSAISCMVVKSEIDATCYAIISFTPDHIKCTLMGGTGEIIEYQRVE